MERKKNEESESEKEEEYAVIDVEVVDGGGTRRFLGKLTGYK